jgi:hypothetical protein
VLSLGSRLCERGLTHAAWACDGPKLRHTLDDSDVADLIASPEAGDGVAEIALFLQRSEPEVRAKMAELELSERPRAPE